MSLPNYREGLGDDTGRIINLPQGFLEYRYTPADGCEIVNIEVKGEYRRTGVGTRLLKILEADPKVRTIYAFTRFTNTIAQIWYRNRKFTALPVQGFYSRNDGAILYYKQVK